MSLGSVVLLLNALTIELSTNKHKTECVGFKGGVIKYEWYANALYMVYECNLHNTMPFFQSFTNIYKISTSRLKNILIIKQYFLGIFSLIPKIFFFKWTLKLKLIFYDIFITMQIWNRKLKILVQSNFFFPSLLSKLYLLHEQLEWIVVTLILKSEKLFLRN